MAEIVRVDLMVGLEIHVELATRSKMFSRAPNGAGVEFADAPTNTLVDPLVLGLPGSLPVLNSAAIEMSMMVGLALGCEISALSRWDRKSYFYPDMPKNYQISQYQLPLCFDGSVVLPHIDPEGKIDHEIPGARIGIIRAHLEEDAGKLAHEAPGGLAIEGSIIDLNRAGTPLLEIVTQPDFTGAEQVVVFARMLRNICRFLGVTEGIMQKGHMRFEPNINTIITLDDGHIVKTPIVEIKNLNSFKSLRGAIEYERQEQPRRWREDGRVMGPGEKTTRGWDEGIGGASGRTFLQREKEDAHDYRYFPDPDLLPLAIGREWVESVRTRVPELPLARERRYMERYGLTRKEAAALVDERDVCLFYEECIAAAVSQGVGQDRAGRACANMVLQSGAKRANERAAAAGASGEAGAGGGVLVTDLGIAPAQVAGIVKLREAGSIGANAADELFGLMCTPEHANAEPAALAAERSLLIVRDEGAIEGWIEQALRENAKATEDVKAGKLQAIGRLVGAVMKQSAGAADAADVRERILKKLGQG